MYEAFRKVDSYLKRKPKIHDPRPDNFVFRLHYQYTFTVLALSVILVTSYGYIDSAGSAIQCMTDKNQVPTDVLNGYCWIMSTFTLPKHFNGTPGVDVIHHGVGPGVIEEEETIYHQYYQWVPLFLSMQALFFYFPHWLWKQLEGGRFDCIMMGLNMSEVDNADSKMDSLVDYMKERRKDKYEHRMWAAKFYFCELLNLINVIVQMRWTDRFLGYSFSRYGTEVLEWADIDMEDRVDPMSRVFPRMTKCNFQKFGPSGTIQNFDAICVLGMNIINEKIFVFLWFWYIALTLATAINLVYRLVTFFVPAVRGKLVILENLGVRPSAEQTNKIHKMVADLSHADWLILYYLSQCMNKKNFYDFIVKMSGSGETHETDSNNARDDSTLQSKSKLKNSFSFRRPSD